MLKDPTNSGRPALRIPRSSDGVEQETNPDNPSDQPVSNGVRGEIEQNPCQHHGDNSHRGRAGQPGGPQGQTCSQNSASLQGVPGSNRESDKDPALRSHGVCGFCFQEHLAIAPPNAIVSAMQFYDDKLRMSGRAMSDN